MYDLYCCSLPVLPNVSYLLCRRKAAYRVLLFCDHQLVNLCVVLVRAPVAKIVCALAFLVFVAAMVLSCHLSKVNKIRKTPCCGLIRFCFSDMKIRLPFHVAGMKQRAAYAATCCCCSETSMRTLACTHRSVYFAAFNAFWNEESPSMRLSTYVCTGFRTSLRILAQALPAATDLK